MGKPQNSPEERINEDAKQGQLETRRVSVLVNFEATTPGSVFRWAWSLTISCPMGGFREA